MNFACNQHWAERVGVACAAFVLIVSLAALCAFAPRAYAEAASASDATLTSGVTLAGGAMHADGATLAVCSTQVREQARAAGAVLAADSAGIA